MIVVVVGVYSVHHSNDDSKLPSTFTYYMAENVQHRSLFHQYFAQCRHSYFDLNFCTKQNTDKNNYCYVNTLYHTCWHHLSVNHSTCYFSIHSEALNPQVLYGTLGRGGSQVWYMTRVAQISCMDQESRDLQCIPFIEIGPYVSTLPVYQLLYAATRN